MAEIGLLQKLLQKQTDSGKLNARQTGIASILGGASPVQAIIKMRSMQRDAEARTASAQAKQAFDVFNLIMGQVEEGLERGEPVNPALEKVATSLLGGEMGKLLLNVLKEREGSTDFQLKSLNRQLIEASKKQVQAGQNPTVRRMDAQEAQSGRPLQAQMVEDLGARVQAGRAGRQAGQRISDIQEQRGAVEQALLSSAPVSGVRELGAENVRAALDLQTTRTPEQLAAITRKTKELELEATESKDKRLKTFQANLNRISKRIEQDHASAIQKGQMQFADQIERNRTLHDVQKSLAKERIITSTEPQEGLVARETGGGVIYVEPPQTPAQKAAIERDTIAFRLGMSSRLQEGREKRLIMSRETSSERLARLGSELRTEETRISQERGQKFTFSNIDRRALVGAQADFAKDRQRAEFQPFPGSLPFNVGQYRLHVEPAPDSEFEAVSNIGKFIQDRDELTQRFGPDDPRVAAIETGLRSALAASEPDLGDAREATALTLFDKPFAQLTQIERGQVQAQVQAEKEAFQAAGRATQPIPSELIVRIGASNTAIRIANDIFKLYSPVFAGPLTGRVGTFKQILGLTSSQETQFRQSLGVLNEMIIRSRTGAQASFEEMESMRAQNPQVTEQPAVVLDKLKASVRQLMANRKSIIEGIQATRGNFDALSNVQPAFKTGLPNAVLDINNFDTIVRRILSENANDPDFTLQDAQEQAARELQGGGR